MELKSIDEAINVLLEMSHENAVLHLPSFIADLCESNQIGTLSSYDFKELTCDLHQALLTECHSHPVNSPLFTASYSLFRTMNENELCLVPLFIQYQKLSMNHGSSTKEIKDTLVKEKAVIGLIISNMLTLPVDQQLIQIQGESKVTLKEIQQKQLLVEGQLVVLEKEGCYIEDINILVNKLLHYQELQIVLGYYELFDIHSSLVYSYLGMEWCRQSKNKGVEASLYKYCTELLQKDVNGNHIAFFMDCLLKEEPCSVIPPFLLDIVLIHAKQGYSSYIQLFDVLEKHKVFDEASRLVRVFFAGYA